MQAMLPGVYHALLVQAADVFGLKLRYIFFLLNITSSTNWYLQRLQLALGIIAICTAG